MYPPVLTLAKLPYPHSPIGVVVKNNGSVWPNDQFATFVDEYELSCIADGNTCIIRDKRDSPVAGVDCLFSGIAFNHGKLVFGADDCPSPASLKEAYGEFSFCEFTDHTIEFCTDYFGFGKWYYYLDEQYFAAATSYHLLLLMLTACGVILQMDIVRSRVNLYEVGFGYTFGQQFSRNMDVKNVFMSLPTEKFCYIKKNHCVSFEKTSLYGLLAQPQRYDEDRYEAAILKAKDEICLNLQAIFESCHFDRIVIDLSGGFDSRVVYAAMTTFPKRLRDKADVFIRDSHLSDDRAIGNAVNNLYGHKVVHPHETDTSEIFINDKLDLFNLSIELGGYSNLERNCKCNINPRFIEVMGGGGDALFGFNRVYGDYAKLFLKYPDDNTIINKIAENSAAPLFKACPQVVDEAANILKEVFEEIPDNLHLYQKLHYFYILFRNNTHFSAFKYQSSLLTLNVLHSKNALIAKWMYWSKFNRNEIPPEKVSIDMINAINPLLAQLPFASENDSVLPVSSDLLQPTTLKVDPDFTISPYKYISERPFIETYSAKARKYTRSLKNARSMLDYIEKHQSAYSEVVGLLRNLLDKIEREQTRPFPFRIINKILHVGYEVAIVTGSSHA